MQLALARLSATARARRVVWVLFDSAMVLALIAAVWGSSLKAVYREMAPWVRPYAAILEGWVVDLWVVRMTSHSLPEWQQEADFAASRDWPRCQLWWRPELRVEVRGLKDRNSHLHRKVVHRCVQQSLVERAAAMGGVSSWLFRDPKVGEGRGPRSGQDEIPRAGWPTPWRRDVHMGVAACSGPARWLALRLASGSLPDYVTCFARVNGRATWAYDRSRGYGSMSEREEEVCRCPRCVEGWQEDAVDGVRHWLLQCPGINGVAAAVRNRHQEIIARRLGLDILAGDLAWWMVPLAAAHVHPECWSVCQRLAGGSMQWASTRSKVLYLLVRVTRMATDMWRVRCRDIYSFVEGTWEAAQREAVVHRSSIVRGEGGLLAPVQAADASAEGGLLEAREEAEEPLDQWRGEEGPEHAEHCTICGKVCRQVMQCAKCQIRHCCGTEDSCPECQQLAVETEVPEEGWGSDEDGVGSGDG
eukprot:gene6312-2273_t